MLRGMGTADEVLVEADLALGSRSMAVVSKRPNCEKRENCKSLEQADGVKRTRFLLTLPFPQ